MKCHSTGNISEHLYMYTQWEVRPLWSTVLASFTHLFSPIVWHAKLSRTETHPPKCNCCTSTVPFFSLGTIGSKRLVQRWFNYVWAFNTTKGSD